MHYFAIAVDARISASGALQSRIVAGNLPLLHL
jgi:hypothetical protein